MARNCPNCSTEMRVETFYGVNLDVCPKCAGVWFDAEELRTLLALDPMAALDIEEKEVPQAALKPGEPSIRHCPDSYLPLQKYHFLYHSPIELDACTDCGGFFVDDGELGKMQQALDLSHMPMTKDEENRLFIAQATIEHENEMRRQANLFRFFTMLRRNMSGWVGFWP